MLLNYIKLYKAIHLDIITHCHHLSVDASIRTHDVIESMLKDETISQNGYKIRFNEAFNEWQTSHPEVGSCEGFKVLYDAVVYCNKG